MNAAEEGVLLLCCGLGSGEARPLTMAQFRTLGHRVRSSQLDGDLLSQVTAHDLVLLGYDEEEADRIVGLLSREDRLHAYLAEAEEHGIYPITRVSPAYPVRVSQKKQLSATPVLFACGDSSLFAAPSVALVGSRHLWPENEAFARTVGRLAAQEDLVLVSGGASGADRTAQKACLDYGGRCIIFVSDRLIDHQPDSRVLYVSEDGWDLPFSAARALHRNGLIHMQGDRTLAAQCTYGSGGTWQGCQENLKHGWSDLFVYSDGSQAMDALMEQGATGIDLPVSLQRLQSDQQSLF